MKSTESKASRTTSQIQAKRDGSFFAKNAEANGPEQTSATSSLQTKPSPTPFFNGNHGIQAKLEIHPSDDAFEKEADAMADRVMQHEHAAPPASPNDANGNGDKPVSPGSLSNSINRLQRQRAFESPTPLEMNTANLAPSDEMPLQRKANDGGTSDAPAAVESTLHSSKGRGASLPKDTREKMEDGFGSDFSNVKVHTDNEAAQMNDQVGARAFTHGNDIYFNKGEYNPNTSSGDHLLAHELTHTIQQNGAVHRKATGIQRGPSPKKTDIFKADKPAMKVATDDWLKKPDSKNFPGEIVTDGNGTVEIHLVMLKAKYYLTPGSLDFLNGGKPLPPDHKIKIKKPRQERNSEQVKKWKDPLVPKIKDRLKEHLKNTKQKDIDPATIYSLKQTKNKSKPAIFGNVDQLANEIVVPPWNKSGTGGLYDIEHKLDYQIAQGLADDIKNLILLDRKENQKLGTSIESIINEHLGKIVAHYADYFSGITASAQASKNKFNVFVKDDLNYQQTPLPPDDFYIDTEIDAITLLQHTEMEDGKVPAGFFLLISSDQRAAYLLPMTETEQQVGSYKVKVKLSAKKDKVTTVTLTPVEPHDPKDVISKGTKTPVDSPIEEDSKMERVYTLRSSKQKLGQALKALIGGVKGMSPIEIQEPELDGFNIRVIGKVISTISFLKDVDISFGYDNGAFFIRAELPLTKLAANIPKPFTVTACSIAIEANSVQGLAISGNARFKIEKFGEGEINASVGKGVAFDGSFNFDSTLFNPAKITVSYANGKWSFEGHIGIKDGTIKGVKEASLKIKYADNSFAADGNAKLSVPGIDSVKLSATYSEAAGFKFVATADLKKLPGIKSGSVTVSILSKPGAAGIILGAAGTAEPDFPGVPGLNSSLTVMYEDGVFDMRAKVSYKKGRFDGTVEVGVTNKSVDDKGQPQGEPQAKGDVVVFGFGSLTVDLFKGSKGTISARITPDKQLLVAGSFTVKDLKPFGEGVNIHKKIVEFPSIKIPIVGVPGVSIFFEIGGGAYFNFNWDPLILKELTIGFTETNINEIETAQVNIHGEVGSKAVAEAYMEITASLGAQVLIAEIKGTLAGDAGIGVEAEAGGALDATWNNEKGLQLKEINAYVSVNPKAIFRLKGSVSVDLDLWLTTINLYYKEWILAEGSADLSGLSLKVNFPLKFDDNGDLIRPGFEQLNIEKPDFSGEQGKAALDGGINGDAKKERKLAKEKLRQQIAEDMRKGRTDDDFSPSEYAEKMQKKYKDDEEIKAFIMDSVEEEVKIQEYEEFDQLKTELRKSELPLNQKIGKAMVFKMFRGRISPSDYDAFINELRVADQQKQEQARLASQAPPAPATA